MDMPQRSRRRPASGGRKPLNRGLIVYNVRCRSATTAEIERQAASMGMPLAVYARLVITEAHDVPWNPLDAESHFPLPTAIPADAMRQAVEHLEADDFLLPRDTDRMRVRLDPTLNVIVETLAERAATTYGRYIGTVLDIAAGTHPGLAGHQPSLLDEGDTVPFADRSYAREEARMAC